MTATPSAWRRRAISRRDRRSMAYHRKMRRTTSVLRLEDDADALVLVAPVAVEVGPEVVDLAGLDAGELAPNAPLHTILVLALRLERPEVAEELPERRVVEIGFGDGFEPDPCLLETVDDDAAMDLDAAEAVGRVDDEEVDLARAGCGEHGLELHAVAPSGAARRLAVDMGGGRRCSRARRRKRASVRVGSRDWSRCGPARRWKRGNRSRRGVRWGRAC